jgi:positive regulator of sigma E activity
MTVLGGLALLSEVWMSGAGARAGGASIWGILAGFVLGAIGLVFFSPIGGLVGLLLGTFLVEYLRLGDRRLALRAVLGAGVGFGASLLVKLGLCLGMAGLWVVWALSA